MNILLGLSGFCLVLSWLIPIHFRPWASFYNEYVAFVALMLLWAAKTRDRKAFSFFLVIGLLLVFLIALQYSLGIYFFAGDALMAVFYILGACAAYQIGLSYRDHLSFINGLAWLLVCGGLISALLGIVQWLELGSQWMVVPPYRRSTGNLAQPNNYASLLFWSGCALSFLYLQKAVILKTFVFLALVLSFGIAASGSRTPLLQSLFFVLLFFWGVRKGILQINNVGVLLPVLLFFIWYFSFPFIDAWFFFADVGGPGLIDRPYSNRLAIWSNLWLPIANSPLLGYGVGQVSVAQFTFLLDFGRNVEFVEYSHNVLMDILIWFGPLIGFVLIGALMYWIGRQFWRAKTKEGWFLLACLGAMLVHGLVEYPLGYAYFLLPFSLMLGLLDSGATRSFCLAKHSSFYGCFWLVFSGILMWQIWKEYRYLEEDNRHMRAQNVGLIESGGALAHVNIYLLDGMREYIRLARGRSDQNMSDDELEWMRKVVYRYPFSAAIYRYGVALALNNRAEEAEEEIEKIGYYYGEEKHEYYKYFFNQSIQAGKEL